jgi:hypothetical protein
MNSGLGGLSARVAVTSLPDSQTDSGDEMRKKHFLFLALGAGWLILMPGLPAGPSAFLCAREKKPATSANDPTTKVFRLLDTSYDGKLEDFYVLGETFTDPAHPGVEWQHVLQVEYSKDKVFGKFSFTVRNISKPTPDQVKAYTTKALYDFGSNAEKYLKTSAGPFGQTGDVYLHAGPDSPLASDPITPEVEAAYEKYLTGTILPALEKDKKTD